ncbi:MAG: JAB-like toxin 1 domain-containing protein, partial [Bacteroidales bacterium]|nr:JAB-like toxin 1 domain-containing protein [Bacteroidales bacterium]
TSPYMVIDPKAKGYTKHYYIESDRFVSKIGGGMAHINYNIREDHVYGMDINDPSDYEHKSRDLFEDGMMFRHFDIIDVHAEVIKDYDFRQISKFQEYDEVEKHFFFYHKDHLGSSTQISDRDANIIHHVEYMPSGEQFSEQRDYWSTPYKFNGKELDAETGLYYYGARYYTPEIGIWLSVDPMSDKYPHQSNYMYCSGRLVNVIDPDGRDEWEVNSTTGKISRINENKHYVDNNGNRVMVKAGEKYQGELDLSSMQEVDMLSNSKGASMDVKAGVLSRPQTNENKFQSFSFGNSSDAESFYYFWAESSKSEIAMCLTNSNAGHVGTDYNSGSTSMTKFYENHFGSSISLMSHSHPNGGPPSMDIHGKFSGDLNAANRSKYDFTREVYDVPKGRIYQYNRQTFTDVKLGRYKQSDIRWRTK